MSAISFRPPGTWKAWSIVGIFCSAQTPLLPTVQVVLPVALGQLARCTPLRKVHERKRKALTRLSEVILLSIMYTTFCDTFLSSVGAHGDSLKNNNSFFCFNARSIPASDGYTVPNTSRQPTVRLDLAEKMTEFWPLSWSVAWRSVTRYAMVEQSLTAWRPVVPFNLKPHNSVALLRQIFFWKLPSQ